MNLEWTVKSNNIGRIAVLFSTDWKAVIEIRSDKIIAVATNMFGARFKEEFKTGCDLKRVSDWCEHIVNANQEDFSDLDDMSFDKILTLGNEDN